MIIKTKEIKSIIVENNLNDNLKELNTRVEYYPACLVKFYPERKTNTFIVFPEEKGEAMCRINTQTMSFLCDLKENPELKEWLKNQGFSQYFKE